MKIVIIGGSGHVGSWLVPRLVEAGHEVTNVSRGTRTPYRKHPAWNHVEHRTIDREAAESDGNFGGIIAGLAPDAVIDMICFTPESARHLVEALRGKVRHFLHCGTIWVHGHSDEVPTTEDRPRRPICEYGRRKAAIEDFLLGEARRGGFPATVLHPGHIVGPGWAPLNPAGNFNPEVFRTLSRGETLALPHHGMETVHHVHADDVARAFILTIDNWRASVGENFHVVSPGALTLRHYAGAVARWFGREPDIRFLPWEEWCAAVSEEEAVQTADHIFHSPCCSIEKARRLLGYEPRYRSLDAVFEALGWLVGQGVLPPGA